VAEPSLAVDAQLEEADEAAGIVVSGVTKRFGGQIALNRVTLSIKPATVHAIAGENGAGKSTLIKILAGVHQPDEGRIFIDGLEVRVPSPREALELGFGFVHQRLDLVSSMTVRENLTLTMTYPRVGPTPIIDWSEVEQRARRSIKDVGLDLRPKTAVRDLTLAQQQLVALARILLLEPRFIVLDEPTASLDAVEAANLLAFISTQRDAGRTIVFVSHRIDELLQIADEITVLRDGRLIETLARQAVTRPALVRLLGGAEEAESRPGHSGSPIAAAKREPRLEVRELTSPGLDESTTLEILRGEVVGLAGLVGSGRTTLARLISGVDQPTSGSTILDGAKVDSHNQSDAARRGIVLLPAERGGALVHTFGVRQNISLGHLSNYSWRGALIRHSAERRMADRYIHNLSIKAAPNSVISSLSGGNQQKVLIARALDLSPKTLVLDEPTAGIDIRTKEYIYDLIRRLARNGVSVLFISSELEELPLVSDRILIFSRGRVLEELPGSATRAEIVGALFRDLASTAVEERSDGPSC
jgi:ribose transport system ATP-binding protein